MKRSFLYRRLTIYRSQLIDFAHSLNAAATAVALEEVFCQLPPNFKGWLFIDGLGPSGRQLELPFERAVICRRIKQIVDYWIEILGRKPYLELVVRYEL